MITLASSHRSRLSGLAIAALLAAILIPGPTPPAAASTSPGAVDAIGCQVQFDTVESEAGFVHPGVGLTTPILENARDQIGAGAEPWTSYYEATKMSSAASLTAKSANESSTAPGTPASTAFDSQGFNSKFIADGLTSYTQALMYVLTGNPQYRANALSIIRIWEQMNPEKYAYFTDSHIHTGIPLNRMVTAAEILRYSSCGDGALPWTEADTTAFTQNLVTPVIETFQHSQNYFMNQHNYPLLGAMAGYIFTDDRARYDESVEWFTVNSTATDQGFNGSVERLFRLVDHDDKTGEAIPEPYVQHIEMGRDQAHGGGDLTNAAIISRMLQAQGTLVDPLTGTVSTASDAVGPYEFLDDRILAAADYFWQYMLGHDTPWTPVAYAISPDGTIRDTYDSLSPSYRGRFNTANFWDLYYYYEYTRHVDLEAVAPHYYEAFSKRLPPNFYYDGALNQNWNNSDGGGDFWLYIPAAAAGSSLPKGQTSATVLPIEDRYTALAGEVSAGQDGDTHYVRLTAGETESAIAFLNGSTGKKQVGFRVRTTGSAELHLSPGVRQSLYLPDTGGEWTTVVVTLGATESIGDLLRIGVTGTGTSVDFDALDIGVGTTLTAPVFSDDGAGNGAVGSVGAEVSLDLSATDPAASDVLTYHSTGLPAGAALDPATGELDWQPAAPTDVQAIVWVTDGDATVVKAVRLRAGADRAGAIAIATEAFDAGAAYVSETLASFGRERDATNALVAEGADSEFAAQLARLIAATGALQPISPRIADGSLDYGELLASSTVGLATGNLTDGDPATGSSYTQAQNLSHTFDFGADFRVSASQFGFQSNIFADRLANSAVFGSNDGQTWTRLTPEVTEFTRDFQTLDVAPELRDEQYRLIRVQLLEPAPDVLYGMVRNLFEMTEFHIVGDRHEIGNTLTSVSISSPDAVSTLIELGDTATVTVESKVELQSVGVTIQGLAVPASSADGVHWTASAELTGVPVGRVGITVVPVAIGGAAGAQAEMTTDGTSLLIGGDASRRIDVAALATVTASDRQYPGTGLSAGEVGALLFDGDAATAGDLNSGPNANYMLDFGPGLAIRPETLLLLPRVGNAARANGTLVQGSQDGVAWTDLSTPIAGATVGQWSPLALAAEGGAYRYLRLTNSTAWFGNLAEVAVYGETVYDVDGFDALVLPTGGATRASAHAYAEQVATLRGSLATEGADRTAILNQLLQAGEQLVPVSSLYPVIAVDRAGVLASSVSFDNSATAADNGWRAFDQNPATSPDAKTGSAWVRVDRGSAATPIASVRLLPRAGNVGRMNGAQIQGSQDGTTFTTLATVSGATTVKWYDLDIADPTAYRFLRYSTSSGFANVAEIEFHARVVDTTLLTVFVDRAQDIQPTGYSAESFDLFQSALDSARTVASDPNATQQAVDAAADALDQGQAGLVPVVTPVVSATYAPPNAAGWYSAPVEVSLVLNEGAAAQVQARIDGGEWAAYMAPIVIGGEGEHTLEYRAVVDGEPVEGSGGTAAIDIDTTAPTLNIRFDDDTRAVMIVAGDSGSGVVATEYRLGASGAWQPYTEPVGIPGAGALWYRSVNGAGLSTGEWSVTLPAAGKGGVDLGISARVSCVNGQAVLALHALNKEGAPADIRLATALGEVKRTAIAPGAAAYREFSGQGGEIEAGAATIAGYTWVDGSASYSSYTVPYSAISCE